MVNVDQRKMQDISNKNIAQMTFDKEYLKNSGIELGKHYNVIYENGKIIITKELESVTPK